MAVTGFPSVPPLTTLYVYVTEGCNCACSHCWIVSAQTPKKKGAFLSPRILDAAIAEAKPLGLASLKWTGGEPTYHPDFPALLAIQKKHGLNGIMESNGMEITPPLAGLLQESGVTFVSVSLDGATAATHDAIRGVKGANRRTIKGIGNLTAAGFRPQLIMSLMRENVGELEELLSLAGSLGAGSVKLNIIQPTLRGEEIYARDGGLSIAELLDLSQRVEHELQPRTPFPIYFDIPPAFRPLERIVADGGASSCGIMGILGLLPDGQYALCGIGRNIPELVFGRAGTGDLEAIWKSHPVLTTIRAGIPGKLKGTCGRCLMRNTCLGTCVAQNYYRTRDLLEPFWFCASAEQQGLFPKKRLTG